jgi:hypothetical protein
MDQNLLVSKEGFQTKLEPAKLRHQLDENEVLVQVDRIALTANVITYAMGGVAMGYYDFYPVENQENQALYGRVPTWGTCTVVASKSNVVPVGQRIYGMTPLSAYFKAIPKPNGDGISWVDSSNHRAKRDVIYNTYIPLDKDPLYPGTKLEDAMILVRPLFFTAWLLREALSDLNMDCAIITSASSKTGAALAALLKIRRGVNKFPKIVGVTSDSNIKYTQSLGYYDNVVTYSNPNVELSAKRYAIVDMAGNLSYLRSIQLHLKERLLKILAVGLTHVAEADMSKIFTGDGFAPQYAKPEFFFAPKYSATLLKKNPQAMASTTGDWLDFIRSYPLDIHYATGMVKIEQVLNEFFRGSVPGSVSWVGLLKTDVPKTSKL